MLDRRLEYMSYWRLLFLGCLRGSVRTPRCRSLLSGDKLPLEEANVCGLEDTECDCDFLVCIPGSPESPATRSVDEDTAETPERGRWEFNDEEAVGGGRAEGRS